MSTAESRAPYDVLTPDHALANESETTTVWWCPGSRMVSMEFASGVRINQVVSEIPDPKTKWASWASDYPDIASVGEVRGELAILIDPAKDASGATPGGLHLVEDGVQIMVLGNGKIALSDLVEIAESLR